MFYSRQNNNAMMNQNQLTFDINEFQVNQSFVLVYPDKKPESGCIHSGRPVTLQFKLCYVCDRCKRLVKPLT